MTIRPSTTLIDKLAAKLSEPASFRHGETGSILTIAGAQYSLPDAIDDDRLTQPTGFDPRAAALFEAVIESAFLVANADGDFDAVEREAFKKVVSSACNGTVSEAQLGALLEDLSDLLHEDGIDKRVKMVAKTITRREQALEVLRVAGLIAHVSQGVSAVERGVLEKLAVEFQLEPQAVEDTLVDVEQALAD